MNSTARRVLKHVAKNSDQELEVIDIGLFLKMEDRKVEECLRELVSEKMVEAREKDLRTYWYPTQAGKDAVKGLSIDLDRAVPLKMVLLFIVVAVLVSGLTVFLIQNGRVGSAQARTKLYYMKYLKEKKYGDKFRELVMKKKRESAKNAPAPAQRQRRR